MNGAVSLLKTLVNGGVEVCFTNPGTSEMHFVAAADRVEGMRNVLGLFEGGLHRGCRRVCENGGKTGCNVAPFGSGVGQWVGQSS